MFWTAGFLRFFRCRLRETRCGLPTDCDFGKKSAFDQFPELACGQGTIVYVEFHRIDVVFCRSFGRQNFTGFGPDS